MREFLLWEIILIECMRKEWRYEESEFKNEIEKEWKNYFFYWQIYWIKNTFTNHNYKNQRQSSDILFTFY